MLTYGATKAKSEATTNGMSSRYGFAAMFKSPDSLGRLMEILGNIATGQKMQVDPEGGASLLPSPPNIVCINYGDTLVDNVLSYCRRIPNIKASHQPGTNFVALCPAFFNLETSPDGKYCPKTKNKAPSPNEAWLQLTQTTAIAHELAHMYLGGGSLKPEVYKIADAYALSAADSLNNPSNYAFFLGGESHVHRLERRTDILQLCLLAVRTGLQLLIRTLRFESHSPVRQTCLS